MISEDVFEPPGININAPVFQAVTRYAAALAKHEISCAIQDGLLAYYNGDPCLDADFDPPRSADDIA